MKKLTTISLFIFFCVTTAILTAGLVFYQDNKNSNSGLANQNINKNIANLATAGATVLDLKEISKHSKSSDCWLLINGKVYDITSYFGEHPGGSGTMSPTCGKDATDAYKTRDAYASTSGNKTYHSTKAVNLLNNYYIGDLNQKISQSTIDANVQKAKSNPIAQGGGDSEEEYEDD